jgi:hypothetical protein
LIWTLLVVSASPSLNSGSTLVAGVSHVSFLASTSFASINVVSALVFDAIMYLVSPSGLAGLPSARTPKPPLNTTLPFSIRPIDTPGTSSVFIVSSTNFVSCAIRSLSSGCAFLPAKDSCWPPFGNSCPNTRPSWPPRLPAVAFARSTINTVHVSFASITAAPTLRFSAGDVV